MLPGGATMSTYSQIAWFPLAGGLTLLGLILSWLAWRRRGAAAGLRGVAWSLLPLAAYLTGAIKMLWQMGTAIGDFASSFVFSPRVWAGVIVAGAAGVLFAVSGGLRRGRAKAKQVRDAGRPRRPCRAAVRRPRRSSRPRARPRARPRTTMTSVT
jgi:hypothetical protein